MLQILFYVIGTPKLLVISSENKVNFSKPESSDEVKTFNIHAVIAASGLVPVRKSEVLSENNNDLDEINHRNDDEGYDDPHDHDYK